MKKLVLLLLVAAVAFGCSLNEYAVKKSIQSGANVGIIAMDYSGDRVMNITYKVARSFLSEGYSVKAINTIRSELTYPFLRELFNGDMELKFKTKIESLLQYTVDTSTPFENEGRIKKELEEIKALVGLDYLVVLYKVNRVFSLVGIDLGNYEIVYVHHFRYTPVPIISTIINLFIPYHKDKKLNQIVRKFINTIQKTGSGEEYSPW